MKHLLVTNDFPPKVGGIQSYLYELWRRLPADEVTVLTTAYDGAAAFDAEQPFRIERVADTFLVPTPDLAASVDALADEVGARLVLLDPAWPLGMVSEWLRHPIGVVLHGAEVTIPARLPFVQLPLRRALRRSLVAIAAGGYPAEEARRAAGRPIPTVVVPPGVDATRFHVPTPDERAATRAALGIDPDAVVVLGLSRLVPRKGFDVLLQAAARLRDEEPRLQVLIGGDGRDRARLEGLASAFGAPARFLGRVPDGELPAVFGAADVFAMVCRDRWLGLEQEGFGIVFLEAAACGVPSVAGRSGGSSEAVVHGETGLVVDQPTDVEAVEEALAALVLDPARRRRLGEAARARAAGTFAYDRLAAELRAALDAVSLPADPSADAAAEQPDGPVIPSPPTAGGVPA